MRIDNINNKQKFKGLNPLSYPLGSFFNKNATIPTLIIETGVTLERTRLANKRGGKKEATYRFIEQGASAVVWLWGVNAIKKITDTVAKKFFNAKNLDFDVGYDALRNPIKNNKDKITPSMVSYKVGNILLSTAVATYFIGFILPKITKYITDKLTSKNDNIETFKPPSLEEFKNKNENKKDIAFKSLLDKGVSIAHTLENNATARLFVTDTGVILGRCKNAKNIYRKIENLFRDISSIYFYLCAVAHSVYLMNKISNNTNIDPKILSKLVDELKDTKMKKQEFLSKVKGEVDKNELEMLNKLFEQKQVVSVDKFIELFPSYKEKALNMAKLQPIFDGKGVLSKMQAQDVLSNGILTQPEFLKDAFNYATNGASDNPLKYVSKKELEKMRTSMDLFVEQVYKAAKSKDEIDFEFIKKIANKNIIKNFAFYSIGTGISIFALGVLIPKIQYAITKKLTNKDEYPGD